MEGHLRRSRLRPTTSSTKLERVLFIDDAYGNSISEQCKSVYETCRPSTNLGEYQLSISMKVPSRLRRRTINTLGFADIVC